MVKSRDIFSFGENHIIMNAFGVIAISDEEKANMTERPLTMRRILTEEERKTILAEGKAEGKTEGKAEVIQSLMNSLKISFEEAVKLLGISDEEQTVITQFLDLKA